MGEVIESNVLKWRPHRDKNFYRKPGRKEDRIYEFLEESSTKTTHKMSDEMRKMLDELMGTNRDVGSSGRSIILDIT